MPAPAPSPQPVQPRHRGTQRWGAMQAKAATPAPTAARAPPRDDVLRASRAALGVPTRSHPPRERPPRRLHRPRPPAVHPTPRTPTMAARSAQAPDARGSLLRVAPSIPTAPGSSRAPEVPQIAQAFAKPTQTPAARTLAHAPSAPTANPQARANPPASDPVLVTSTDVTTTRSWARPSALWQRRPQSYHRRADAAARADGRASVLATNGEAAREAAWQRRAEGWSRLTQPRAQAQPSMPRRNHPYPPLNPQRTPTTSRRPTQTTAVACPRLTPRIDPSRRCAAAAASAHKVPAHPRLPSRPSSAAAITTPPLA